MRAQQRSPRSVVWHVIRRATDARCATAMDAPSDSGDGAATAARTAGTTVRRPCRESSGRDLGVDLERRLRGRRGEATVDARFQPGHQGAVAELLPALLRVMD